MGNQTGWVFRLAPAHGLSGTSPHRQNIGINSYVESNYGVPFARGTPTSRPVSKCSAVVGLKCTPSVQPLEGRLMMAGDPQACL